MLNIVDPIVNFNAAKKGMVLCREGGKPVEVVTKSGDWILLELLPTADGRQYTRWPREWLEDLEFDAAEFVLDKREA